MALTEFDVQTKSINRKIRYYRALTILSLLLSFLLTKVIIFILPLLFLFIWIFYLEKKNSFALLKSLKILWGKKNIRSRNYDAIKSNYYLYKNESNDNIDDQTWSDLNLDDIYSIIDRTFSCPGEFFYTKY